MIHMLNIINHLPFAEIYAFGSGACQTHVGIEADTGYRKCEKDDAYKYRWRNVPAGHHGHMII